MIFFRLDIFQNCLPKMSLMVFLARSEAKLRLMDTKTHLTNYLSSSKTKQGRIFILISASHLSVMPSDSEPVCSLVSSTVPQWTTSSSGPEMHSSMWVIVSSVKLNSLTKKLWSKSHKIWPRLTCLLQKQTGNSWQWSVVIITQLQLLSLN